MSENMMFFLTDASTTHDWRTYRSNIGVSDDAGTVQSEQAPNHRQPGSPAPSLHRAFPFIASKATRGMSRPSMVT